MKVTELAEEINFQCERAEPQDEQTLAELEHHYHKMFQTYCNAVVDFEIVNPKGQIQLKGFVL